MNLLRSILALSMVFMFLGDEGLGQTRYSLTELNVASAGRDMRLGLNNSGQVVGQPTGSLQFAWMWDQGALTQLGALGTGDGSAAYDINDSGHVIGSSNFLAGNTTNTTFFYADGVMHNIGAGTTGLVNAAQVYATSINANSDVTGWSVTDNGRPGILWDVDTSNPTGGTTNLTFTNFRKPLAINDSGDAAGATLQFEEGLVREATGTLFGLGQIPDTTFGGSWARDISNSKLVVGGGSFADFGNVRHAARWDKVGGTYGITDLHSDVLLLNSSAHSSDALAVNELDQIVGWYAVGADGFATMWDPTYESLNLFDQLLDAKGWTGLYVAHDINEQGQILVTGRDSSAQIRLALLSPTAVPEPSSIGVIGLATLLLLSRRRIR